MKYFDEATIEKIRKGYYSAVYFNRTKEILLKEKNLKRVTMQIFQKKENSIVAGVEEVRELLLAATGYFEGNPPAGGWIDKSGELTVESVKDGESVGAWESVMHIRGPYAYFAHLESIYLGILARRTWIATNMKKCITEAGNVPVIFFGDRFDYFLNQEGDGYAAKIGGASDVCTPAHTAWIKGEPVGTIPHAMISINEGRIETAAELFNKYYPDVRLIALCDFDNDCVASSLRTAKKLGNRLWGVRIDTAAELSDKSLGNAELKGVNPTLVKLVREALDKAGFSSVKIVVSGGFSPSKIRNFIQENVPVDAYGVGSAIIHGDNDFTADVVLVDGKPMAKAGRQFKDNEKLQKLI